MKKLILLLAILVLTFTLSGCAYKNDCEEQGGKYYFSDGECLLEQEDELIEEYEEVYNRDVNLTLNFDEDYDYWLVRIVSRERDEERDIYIYETEEVGDEDYIVVIESEELISINELALGVETGDALFIVDFNNRNVVIPNVTCPTEPLPAMSTEEFRAYLLVEYPDLAPYFRFNEEELE